MLWLLFWLETKHFVADWIFQPRYMHANKGTFGHPGGLLHALVHACLTGLILLAFVSPELAFFITVAEYVAHYLIDWAKMNLNRRWGLKPIPEGPYRWPWSERFWMFLGFDQWLHQLCYIAILWVVTWPSSLLPVYIVP